MTDDYPPEEREIPNLPVRVPAESKQSDKSESGEAREGTNSSTDVVITEMQNHRDSRGWQNSLIVWEVEKDCDEPQLSKLKRGEEVICTIPYWQGVALARFHNESLATTTRYASALGSIAISNESSGLGMRRVARVALGMSLQ